jgi:hypothetical protein
MTFFSFISFSIFLPCINKGSKKRSYPSNKLIINYFYFFKKETIYYTTLFSKRKLLCFVDHILLNNELILCINLRVFVIDLDINYINIKYIIYL